MIGYVQSFGLLFFVSHRPTRPKGEAGMGSLYSWPVLW